jgi:hypothetical protein
MDTIDTTQLGRGRRRAARENVNYRESDEVEDPELVVAVSKPERKKHLRQVDINNLTNQMSRPQLEKLVCSLYKSSPEFRASYKAEVEAMLAREQDELPRVHNLKLGQLSKLPSESMLAASDVIVMLTMVVLINILGFLKFKDRKTMTTLVSPCLNEYKWVSSLWYEIDTKEIPYAHLLDKIIPRIKRIQHLTVVYKHVCTSLCEGIMAC